MTSNFHRPFYLFEKMICQNKARSLWRLKEHELCADVQLNCVELNPTRVVTATNRMPCFGSIENWTHCTRGELQCGIKNGNIGSCVHRWRCHFWCLLRSTKGWICPFLGIAWFQQHGTIQRLCV